MQMPNVKPKKMNWIIVMDFRFTLALPISLLLFNRITPELK